MAVSCSVPVSRPAVPRRALIRKLFLLPLKQQRSRVIWIVASLAMVSGADSLIILMMKPFTEVLFGELRHSSSSVIHLGELLPPAVYDSFEWLKTVVISRTDLVAAVPFLMFAAGVIKAAGSYFYQICQQSLTLYIAKNYRDQLFGALMEQDYEYITRRPASDWMSIIMNDVQFLQIKFSDILNGLVRDSLTVVVAYSILLLVHWQTALGVVLVAPVLAWVMGGVGRKIAGYSVSIQSSLAEIAGAIIDTRKRFRFIRSQCGEINELTRFEKANTQYFFQVRKSVILRSAFAPILEFLGFAFLALMIVLLGLGLIPDLFAGGNLVTFFVAIGIMVKPLRNIGEQLSKFHETKGALQSSLDVFYDSLASSSAPAPRLDIDLKPFAENLAVASMQAMYGGEVKLSLKNFEIKSREHLVVVGASGSGKSTFLKIMAGLVKPSYWEGAPSLERVVSSSNFVSQTPFLFPSSIYDNLLYGQKLQKGNFLGGVTPKYLELKVWKALEDVGLAEFVRSLPKGLQSEVSGFASNLSGGQVQRLVVARALVRGKSILLLDEATSAIDAKTEFHMLKNLRNRCKENGMMLISVTHRLNHLEQYDRVLFLEDGEIAGFGTHEELQKIERYRIFISGR